MVKGVVSTPFFCSKKKFTNVLWDKEKSVFLRAF